MGPFLRFWIRLWAILAIVMESRLKSHKMRNKMLDLKSRVNIDLNKEQLIVILIWTRSAQPQIASQIKTRQQMKHTERPNDHFVSNWKCDYPSAVVADDNLPAVHFSLLPAFASPLSPSPLPLLRLQSRNRRFHACERTPKDDTRYNGFP